MLAKGSINWILMPLVIAVGAWLLKLYPITVIGVIMTAFFTIFFRDPERVAPRDGMASPADGVVLQAGEKVSIFMRFRDVHVNRAPISGVVKKIEHKKGEHRPAFSKGSSENEQNRITIETEYGEVIVTQIAGILARRIVCHVKEGEVIAKGQRIGMVRFGSRVEVTIPDAFNVVVKKGDRVRAGGSIIARLV
ncbi:MAG: phosphatidylserine decarboxylase [Methanocellales archaeon]|nr:phosphatidylserine decarboxylase [Methanocellales archaeon]